MKAHKIDDVEYSVNLISNDRSQMNLIWKSGQLFLSITGMYLSHDRLWYELPLRDITGIRLLEGERGSTLEITIGNVNVTVSGKSSNYLKALRHLLLPYITSHVSS